MSFLTKVLRFTTWSRYSNIMKQSATRPSQFAQMPPREKADEGEIYDIEAPSLDIIREFAGLTEEQVARSSYFAIEKSGKVYHVFNAQRYSYGRMCAKIAYFLQGKHKPIFRPSQSGYGDACIVVNSEKLKIVGQKKLYKKVRYHSGYVGHLHEIPFRKFIEEKPEQLIHLCVSKMLPKNKLREEWLKKLHVFRGPNHEFSTFLPTFTHDDKKQRELQKYKKMVELDPKTDKIIFESETAQDDEFAEFQREIDPTITKSFQERNIQYNRTPENKKVMAKIKAWQRKLKRYRVYEWKQPKNRDPRLSETAVHIRSQYQIDKYGLQEYVPPDTLEEDEDFD